MDKFYQFFADTFPHLFGFIGKAIPPLAEAAEVVRYILLILGLVLVAAAVVSLIVGCFKTRFFRRLARVLLIIETLGAAGLCLIAANTVKTGDIPADMVKALEIGSPEVFGIYRKIFIDFGDEAIVPSFVVGLITFIVICAILHLIIVLSRIIVKRSEERGTGARIPDAAPTDAAPEAVVPEVVPAPAAAAPTTATTAPAAAPAAAPSAAVATVEPVEEPIVPADVPEPELETVFESDATPDVESVPEQEETAEDAAEEDYAAAIPEEPPVPDYPKLEKPIFMPVPSAVSDTVDFTDPKRDGFTPNPGVYVGLAELQMTDEAAEDLTAVVYRKVEGKVVELPIDALSTNFKPYSYVDARILRQKGLIPETAEEVKITAFGKIDKPLMVQASCFAPGVTKMIILAGGRPIQVM